MGSNSGHTAYGAPFEECRCMWGRAHGVGAQGPLEAHDGGSLWVGGAVLFNKQQTVIPQELSQVPSSAAGAVTCPWAV